MGMREVWDGDQLPPVGCDVLIHLNSVKMWVPYTVTGYDIKPSLDGDKACHRIFILVKGADHVSNSLLLCDVRQLTWREVEDK